MSAARVVGQGGADAVEVEVVVVGHLVELVGGRELDVTPGVGEQLGELGLLGLELDDGLGQVAEQASGPVAHVLRAARDDLRQREQLLHRLALGDALGAEGDVDRESELREHPLDTPRDTGVDGAAQHQQLTVVEVVGGLGERPGDHVRVGVEVLVDRRADHDHDHVGERDDRGIRADAEPARVEDPLEDLTGAGLLEGQLPALDELDRGLVDVVDADVEPTIGEGDREREPDVPAAADHDDVVGGARRGSGAGNGLVADLCHPSLHAASPPEPGGVYAATLRSRGLGSRVRPGQSADFIRADG
jgi:hypothetical protein